MSKLREIFIYSDHPSKSLMTAEILDYLRGYGLSVKIRGNLFEFLHLAKEEAQELARNVAGTRILDISEPLDQIREPIYGEIGVELRRFKGEASMHGLLYDAFFLQRIFHRIMAGKIGHEMGNGFLHIVFTSRLFGTFEIEDPVRILSPFDISPERIDSAPRSRRYHARVILTGKPAFISTSGLVEAPAKPKEYYWLKAGFIRGGKDVTELDEIYRGRFIEYDDSRISQILKAYVLQAIVYELVGDPFCDSPSCCLFNSHWQEEVLNTQLEGKLCERHRNILSQLG